MKAGTLSPAKSLRPGSRVKPILFWSIAALVLLCVGLVLWFLSVAHSALPQLDGALAVRGLSAPVSVTRDGHGVPTIDALTMDDLFFAQGYVTAQDRLFQMDLLRRAAEGELSEIAGEGALKHDRQQRILGLRAAAEKGVLVATPDDHRQFQ
jgi:penicillin amidase